MPNFKRLLHTGCLLSSVKGTVIARYAYIHADYDVTVLGSKWILILIFHSGWHNTSCLGLIN